jgi:hypothetical protein
MSKYASFKQITDIDGIEKVSSANYLGFQLSFSNSVMLRYAKKNVKTFLYNIKSRIRTNSALTQRVIHQAFFKSKMLY